MRRTAVFILLCLLFGALLSVAVAWWVAPWEWRDWETFSIQQNGWKAGVVHTPTSTSIGAIHVERSEFALALYGFPTGFDYLTETSPPAWFSLSNEPTNEEAMIRGHGAGWPLTCVSFVQEVEGESLFPEWDFVTSGGLVGTNPFNSEEEYKWYRNHLPLRVVPMGLLVDALVLGLAFAILVVAVRLSLRFRAKLHQRCQRCPRCKYDLTGSASALCSECGADRLSLPVIVSRGTTVLSGAVALLLLMALVGFGVVFSAQPPYSQLHYAAYRGDIRTVRNELAAGQVIDAAASTSDWPGPESTYAPLMLACAGGRTEIVRYLIDSGADLEAQSSFGMTASHMAVQSGSLDCLSLLLENGADANAQVRENNDALVFLAVDPDYDPQLLDRLLEAGYRFESNGAPIDEAIVVALSRENEKFIHRLLELGAVPGYEALKGAVQKGRVDWLELFVEHGADLGVTSEYGWTVLYSVTPDNNLKDVVEFLFQHEQKINTADEDGVTALMIAVARGSSDLCRIFLGFGADPHLRDDKGMSALDHAIEYSRTPGRGVVLVLLDAGAEVRLVDEEGEPRFKDLDPELLKLLQENTGSKSKEKQPGQ